MRWHLSNIHGIREGVTDSNWIHEFGNDASMRFPGVTVSTQRYKAWIIPPINLWITNPVQAKFHANRIREFGEACRRVKLPAPKNLITAHSNGTNIAVDVAKSLAKTGHRVDVMILMGSAVHSDIERSGLQKLVSEDAVGQVFAYCSPDDPVIGPLQGFPGFYGSLGSVGFTLGKDEHGKPKRVGLQVEGYQRLGENWGDERQRFVTRWFPGFGHGEWVDEEHKAETYRCFERDLGLSLE